MLDSSLNCRPPSIQPTSTDCSWTKCWNPVLGTRGIRRLIIQSFFTSRGSPTRGKKKNESTTAFNARRTVVNILTKFQSKSHKMTEARIINFSPGNGRLAFYVSRNSIYYMQPTTLNFIFASVLRMKWNVI